MFNFSHTFNITSYTSLFRLILYIQFCFCLSNFSAQTCIKLKPIKYLYLYFYTKLLYLPTIYCKLPKHDMLFSFSHTSGTTLLALPAEIYRFGASYWLISLTMIVIVLLTAHVYLPVFFNLQITSTYEYLEMRFDSKVRNFASFLFTISRLLFLPIVIYIPALACSSGELHTFL